MTWRSLQYDLPTAAWLIPIVILIAWAFMGLYRYRERHLNAFADKSMWNSIMQNRLPVIFWVKVVLCGLVWLFGVIAIMQPKGNERYAASNGDSQSSGSSSKQIVRKPMKNVILLVDASASMGITDMGGGLSRLQYAKNLADQIVSRLQGENVSLSAFTSSSIQLVPLTTDYFFTRLMIRQININEGDTVGTNFTQAFSSIEKQFLNQSSVLIPKTLIVLTDGGDTALESLEGQQYSQAFNALIKPLQSNSTESLNVIVVGIGSKRTSIVPNVLFNGKSVNSSLDTKLLQKIADALSGNLLIADELTFLEISRMISSKITNQKPYGVESEQQVSDQGAGDHLYDDYFQIPLAIALLALALFLLIPDTRTMRNMAIPILFLSSSMLCAEDSLDVITKAQIFYEAGDFQRAQNSYEMILKNFLPDWQIATVRYNLGTSLLKQEQWRASLKQFRLADSVLNISPILKKRISINTAVASLMLVKTKAMTNELRFQTNLHQSINTSDLIEIAAERCCDLDRAEGSKECHPHLEIESLRNENNRLVASIVYEYMIYKLMNPIEPPKHIRQKPKQSPTKEESMSSPAEIDRGKEEKNQALTQVLRQLQEMESDDHSNPQLIYSPDNNQSVDRPW